MIKMCYTCRQRKPLDTFNKNKSRKDGLNSIFRECSKTRSKQYYRDNPIKHKRETAKRNKRIREELKKLISLCKTPCKLCGEAEKCCLEFHHINPKKKKMTIGSANSGGYSLAKVQQEIDKCVVLCSNCHKKVHTNILHL